MSGPTIADALDIAREHWADRPGSKVMGVMAGRAAVLVGEAREAASLRPADGVALLSALRAAGLSPTTVQGYYGSLRRALNLAGCSTPGWPAITKAAPCKPRQALTAADVAALIAWLDGKGWSDTADLVRLLWAAGLRVQVEALPAGRFTVVLGDDYDVLTVGAGEGARLVPVGDPEAIGLLSYRGHLVRWTKALAATLGDSARGTGLEAVRRAYAEEALRKCGGNAAMVADLMGRAVPPLARAGCMVADLMGRCA
jgi:integrase